eukprot:scaffold15011_cov89-Skeletonema_dohrnii-CCMP3373.AAC.2
MITRRKSTFRSLTTMLDLRLEALSSMLTRNRSLSRKKLLEDWMGIDLAKYKNFIRTFDIDVLKHQADT